MAALRPRLSDVARKGQHKVGEIKGQANHGLRPVMVVPHHLPGGSNPVLTRSGANMRKKSMTERDIIDSFDRRSKL